MSHGVVRRTVYAWECGVCLQASVADYFQKVDAHAAFIDHLKNACPKRNQGGSDGKVS